MPEDIEDDGFITIYPNMKSVSTPPAYSVMFDNYLIYKDYVLVVSIDDDGDCAKYSYSWGTVVGGEAILEELKGLSSASYAKWDEAVKVFKELVDSTIL